ncbi:MAG: sulfite exporter TauE/SafE family protein [Candidatus Omnitrophica bacterium]|jgi:thiol:disulfide interchange protein DsbD|nr:sulfite exporter TauE/SafE family protein [Candidatus Omnitrophota bacterium]
MTLSASQLSYLTAFLSGIGVSLTPCIYPLIPITAGYIGANSQGSKMKGFLLSFVYVTGVAITYSILGIIASLTGTLFGRISSMPITYFIVGSIIILFGLSMLDLFRLPFPGLAKQPVIDQQNYLGAFTLGLSAGLLAMPCLTPVLGTILLYLAGKKNLFYGATLLLSFAYGMGLILILVGTFSAVLTNLPKSGKWSLYIKKAFAFILLITGMLFILGGMRRL